MPSLLALAAVSLVPGAQTAAPAGPTGLRAFLLRADEPALDTFPRTPSFDWAPYERATSYDFELATSKTFDDSDDRLVDRQPEDAAARPGGGDPDLTAVDDRQPLRAVRPRPRAHRVAA